MTVVFGEPLLAYVWAAVAAVGSGLYLRASQPVVSALFALAAVALAVVTSRPTTVFVGADGLVVRWLVVTRFFPYASLAAVETHTAYARASMGTTQRKSSGLLLRRRDGTGTYVVCDDATARDLRAAVAERLDAHRRAAAADVPQLRRGARSFAAWTRELRALLEDKGYREGTPTADALFRLLEDPTRSAEERAAAALALHAHLGDDARRRLRVASDACASPKLRVAFEAIADGDEESALAHLERLSVHRRE